MLRFIKKLQSRVNKRNENSSLNPDQFITVEEIYHSEKLWIEEIQKEIYTNEHYNNWEKNLGLFSDSDGILRCKGRFRYSSLNYDEKHPAIIPRGHRLTSLIASDAHSKVLHGGVANKLAKVIEKFWIIRGRQLVKKTIKTALFVEDFRGFIISCPPLLIYQISELTLPLPLLMLELILQGLFMLTTKNRVQVRKRMLYHSHALFLGHYIHARQPLLTCDVPLNPRSCGGRWRSCEFCAPFS